jgi:exopolyphosphatase/guanosine-5'-triphosphate,3'-diphosphate pyrophosphatase
MPSDPILADINPAESLAAIDLGSNSFHMIVARPLEGDFQVIDRLKEMVRLAEGLTEDRDLSPR